MHFTGTSTGGVCLAWRNVEHLFLFPQECWIISEHGSYRGAKEEGWGYKCRGRKKGAAVSYTYGTFLSFSA